MKAEVDQRKRVKEKKVRNEEVPPINEKQLWQNAVSPRNVL